MVDYFQHFGAKLERTVNDNTHGDWAAVLIELIKLIIPHPRRAQLHQLYSSDHWETRIETRFKVDWEEEQIRLRTAGKDVPSKPPVDFMMRTAKRCWDAENAEVRAEVETKREDMYAADMNEYNELLKEKKEAGKEYRW